MIEIAAILSLTAFLEAYVLGVSFVPTVILVSFVALSAGVRAMFELHSPNEQKILRSADPKWLLDAKQQFVDEEINQLEFEVLLDKGFAGELVASRLPLQSGQQKPLRDKIGTTIA